MNNKLKIQAISLGAISALGACLPLGELNVTGGLFLGFSGIALVALTHDWTFRDNPIRVALTATAVLLPLLLSIGLLIVNANANLVELAATITPMFSILLAFAVTTLTTFVQWVKDGGLVFAVSGNDEDPVGHGWGNQGFGFYGATGIRHPD